MIINSDTTGLEFLRLRVDEAKLLLPGLLVDTAQIVGESVAQALGDAAPQGQGSGDNPSGDAPGPLAESFYAESELQANAGVAVVKTTQPTKLGYVRYGTGVYGKYGQRIVPTTKRALFWEGADHPFRSVAGQKPNDFISPVLAEVKDIIEPEVNAIIDELRAILEGV